MTYWQHIPFSGVLDFSRTSLRTQQRRIGLLAFGSQPPEPLRRDHFRPPPIDRTHIAFKGVTIVSKSGLSLGLSGQMFDTTEAVIASGQGGGGHD